MQRLIDLTMKLKNKDETAFDEFYELTKDHVFYNIVKYVDSFDDAEDILQDTYISFLEHISSIKDNHSPVGYLLITAKTKSIDFLRKRKRVINDSEYIDTLYHLEYKEIDNPIFKNIKDKLSKEELELMIMHVIDDMTFKEISKLQKKPLGTILWRYNKIIGKLRKELDINDYR